MQTNRLQSFLFQIRFSNTSKNSVIQQSFRQPVHRLRRPFPRNSGFRNAPRRNITHAPSSLHRLLRDRRRIPRAPLPVVRRVQPRQRRLPRRRLRVHSRITGPRRPRKQNRAGCRSAHGNKQHGRPFRPARHTALTKRTGASPRAT